MSDSGRARDWGTTEPCQFCGHIHPYYVVCEVCECDRHRPPLGFDLWQAPCREPTEILMGFLFLGDYNNNAFRMDLRYTMGINRALNITTLCGPTFHSEIVKCVGLIQKCERKRESVVVYCINGINRAAAVVIGYLMKFRHWSLEKSYEYVRELRPSVDMSDLVVHEGLIWYEQAIITKKYKLPPGAARASRSPKNQSFLSRTFSFESSSYIYDWSPSSVRLFKPVPGVGQATEISANQANPNIAGSSRIDAPKHNYLRTRAPTYSCGNAEGFLTPTFSTGTDTSIFDSSPSSVPPNELITGAGQATEISANQANPNIASSSRTAASNYNFQDATALTYGFGNVVGVPTPTFSTGTGNSIFDSSPSSVPPNELITGAGQATEISANQANPNIASSSRIDASNYNFQHTIAPTYSFGNQANPNIASSSRIDASNYNFQHTIAPTYSFGNAVGVPTPTFSTGTGNSIFDSSPSSVPPNELITGAGQATEVSFMANQASPNIASSSRTAASNYNFQHATAPTYSFGNVVGVPTPTFSTGTGNSIFVSSPSSVPPNELITGAGQATEVSFMANQASPNIAGSSRIAASYYNLQYTTAPTYSFGNAVGVPTPTFSKRTGNSIFDSSPSSVTPNELITGTGQATEVSYMANQASPNIAGSSRIAASNYNLQHTTAPTYSFGNVVGVPTPTFSTGTGNSIFDSSPSSVPPNELITEAGQATEASFVDNEGNPDDIDSFLKDFSFYVE